MAKWISKSHRVKTEAPQDSSSRSSTFPTRSRRAGTKKYVRAHEEIIKNEHWYGDDAPSLGRSFTAKKTAERHQEVVQILVRAAKRAAKAGFEETCPGLRCSGRQARRLQTAGAGAGR